MGKRKSELNCPVGYHLVRAHSYHVPPSKKNPNGLVVTRQEHCAKNRPKKTIVSRSEIQQIQKNFSHLTRSPKVGVLKKFGEAKQYDNIIRGWVQHWNDILKPEDPLDPDVVKALIATESSFNSMTNEPLAGKREGKARGLMQVTDLTLKILGDAKGELKDNLVNLTHDDLEDPSLNICAGVRWLYRKKVTASARLGRSATWEEAVADYKDYLRGIISGEKPNPQGMIDFRRYYKELKDSENETKTNDLHAAISK